MQNKLNSIFLIMLALSSCQEKKDRSWGAYKADAASTSYSAHDQINLGNVNKLQEAWTFYPDDAAEGSRFNGSQCNPIIVDGVIYTASARHRIYAIDAKTGRKIWGFDPFDGGPGGGSFRGVTYWEDPAGNNKRILFTGGDQLFALDAGTGRIIPEFGDKGRVSMNVGIRDDPKLISIKPTSPGIIYQDLIIIGNEVSELYGAQPGYVRAYNVRTGKLVWTFHTIPLPGEVGYETWPKDAWKYAGGANDWGGMSVDEKRGMVFLATGSPAYDFYGADREGKNLFGNCVVALDAKTGKYIWHFQTIHHDLWDYDLPAPPNLVTVTRDGKKIDAVAQTSKVGFLYVLNRETGESLFPIGERPVPASDVPGEKAWPTQPFPLKPKPYARQTLTEDDLSDYSPEAHDSLVQLFRRSRYEGLFTPPSVKGSISFPGTIGGSEWGGAAYDPATGVIYLKSNESPEMARLVRVDNSKLSSGDVEGRVNGREIYITYCASCHKPDRTGSEPLYPSLLGLNKRMSEEQAEKRVREGGGKMPPFGRILNGKEKAVVDFLFEKRRDGSMPNEFDLKEIQHNRTTNSLVKADPSHKDTGVVYLNTLAYAQMRDLKGHPAIKPPYGTLNAIDVSTGDYLWTVPAGNIGDLQKKGAPSTGSTGSPGPIVTGGGLVFLGGGHDRNLQAYDKKTGKLVWEHTLPSFSSSSPSSYMVDGKQYIVVSVAGDKTHPAGMIMAFALPDGPASSARQTTATELFKASVLTPAGSFTNDVEGPAVDKNGILYAVNFQKQGTIGKIRDDGTTSIYLTLPEGSTGNGIRFDSHGNMLIADYTGHNILKADAKTHVITVLAHEPSMHEPNDIAIDSRDRLYASDPDFKSNTGRIWRIDPDSKITLLDTVSEGAANGIEVSPDENTLYVNGGKYIWAYDLRDGRISNRRVLVKFADFTVDGMRCDIKGNIYIARFGKGVIAKISPKGEVLREIPTAGKQTTNVAFGGKDGRTVFVTLMDKGNIEWFRVDEPGREWKMLREK